MNQNINNNLQIIKKNIEVAKQNLKINNDVTILGVTKTIDCERINGLIDLGILNIGENKVQELLEKYYKIKKDVNWHFIGNLQTNKVKYIIDKVNLIHSVSNLKLAEEINKRAEKINKKINILIQINIANEPSKNGINPKEVNDFVQQILKYNNLIIKGLMTVAPFVEKQEENRQYFRNMKKIFIDINNKNKDNINMKYLSMGMSNDYQVAIEEGANIVRLGTAIFGERN